MILTHPELIHKIIESGVEKTSASLKRVVLMAVCAGAFISLGGLLSLVVGYGFPEISESNPGLQKLLSGSLFPVGLFLVVTLGADLFTGSNALLVPGCAVGRIGCFKMLCHWTIVWIFNFVGALLFTLLFAHFAGIFEVEQYKTSIVGIAESKAALPFGVAFIKGVAANWCVCIAVWLALMVKSLPAKAIACWIPVCAFVMLGYEHSIANMFFIPAGMMQGADVSIPQLFSNLIPVTLGNIVGGSILVGLLYFRLHFIPVDGDSDAFNRGKD